jgi:hypothetical protein
MTYKKKAASFEAAFVAGLTQNWALTMSCTIRPEAAALWKFPYGLLGADTVAVIWPNVPDARSPLGLAKFG